MPVAYGAKTLKLGLRYRIKEKNSHSLLKRMGI
jgi:hypothetical protein